MDCCDHESCRYIYRIDADNNIQWVDENWMPFACDNQAQELDPKNVIGTPLFHYVTGTGAQHLYHMIIDRVRQSQLPAVIPFRCDGPDVRRFMELRITPCDNGAVELEGRILREEPRRRVPLFDLTVKRTGDFVKMCSWCKKVQVNEEWKEVEDALEEMKLFNEHEQPQLTHGVCPACSESIRQELEKTG